MTKKVVGPTAPCSKSICQKSVDRHINQVCAITIQGMSSVHGSKKHMELGSTSHPSHQCLFCTRLYHHSRLWTLNFIMPGRRTVSHTYLEELIELVRQNLCLYDPALSSHKDAVMAENVRQGISKWLMVGNPAVPGRLANTHQGKNPPCKMCGLYNL